MDADVFEVQAVSVSNLRINLDDLLHARTVESERIEFKATWDQRVTLSCLGGEIPRKRFRASPLPRADMRRQLTKDRSGDRRGVRTALALL